MCGRMHKREDVVLMSAVEEDGRLYLAYGCQAGINLKGELRRVVEENDAIKDSGNAQNRRQAFSMFLETMGPEEFALIRPWYELTLKGKYAERALANQVVALACNTSSHSVAAVKSGAVNVI
jgi:hypothetical protein